MIAFSMNQLSEQVLRLVTRSHRKPCGVGSETPLPPPPAASTTSRPHYTPDDSGCQYVVVIFFFNAIECIS